MNRARRLALRSSIGRHITDVHVHSLLPVRPRVSTPAHQRAKLRVGMGAKISQWRRRGNPAGALLKDVTNQRIPSADATFGDKISSVVELRRGNIRVLPPTDTRARAERRLRRGTVPPLRGSGRSCSWLLDCRGARSGPRSVSAPFGSGGTKRPWAYNDARLNSPQACPWSAARV